MSRKSVEAFNEIVVGVFMTVVIGLLAYFTIVISGVDILRGDGVVEMKVVFDQVGGLKDHDNVMYRGTKVGKVEDVTVTPSNLVVRATVNRNVVLREGYTISVSNLSLLGGNYMLLEEGEGEVVDMTATTFRGRTPTDWMRDVAVVAARVRELTEMGEIKAIVTNVANVSAKADRFMDRAECVAEGAQEVVKRVDGFMAKAENVAAGAEEFMAKANAAADQVQLALTEARAFIDRASSAAGSIDRAAVRADGLLARFDNDQLFDDIQGGIAAFRKACEGFDTAEITARANELVANLNDVALTLKNGEGTLGKLINDPKLYNEVQGAVKDARQVLDNFRDTTPISTFSSLATGAL